MFSWRRSGEPCGRMSRSRTGVCCHNFKVISHPAWQSYSIFLIRSCLHLALTVFKCSLPSDLTSCFKKQNEAVRMELPMTRSPQACKLSSLPCVTGEEGALLLPQACPPTCALGSLFCYLLQSLTLFSPGSFSPPSSLIFSLGLYTC